MYRKKDGIAKMKLTITQEPDGPSYVQHLASEDLSMQLTVRDLTVVDLRRPKTEAGARVIVARRPEAAEGGSQ